MSGSVPPFLLLDVDGPIVVFGTHEDDEKYFEVMAGDLPLTIARKLPTRLAVLQRHFRLVWSTSWQRTANTLLSPIVGLPQDLPFLDFDRYPPASPGESRKMPAFKSWLRDKPAAIVDDEIGEDMRVWASRREWPTLLIEVDPRVGIQDHHVLELLAFARRLT